jgi:hypothetical protein
MIVGILRFSNNGHTKLTFTRSCHNPHRVIRGDRYWFTGKRLVRIAATLSTPLSQPSKSHLQPRRFSARFSLESEYFGLKPDATKEPREPTAPWITMHGTSTSTSSY